MPSTVASRARYAAVVSVLALGASAGTWKFTVDAKLIPGSMVLMGRLVLFPSGRVTAAVTPEAVALPRLVTLASSGNVPPGLTHAGPESDPRPSWRENSLWKTPDLNKERKKEQKRKEGLWKLTPLMEIRQERGFPPRLEKSLANNARLFHSSHKPDGGDRLTRQPRGSPHQKNDENGENEMRVSTELTAEGDSIAVPFPRPHPLLTDTGEGSIKNAKCAH